MEKCRAFGTGVLRMTAGICPVTMCVKGLFNGPCGVTNKGSCEINSGPACAVESRLKNVVNKPSITVHLANEVVGIHKIRKR